MTKYNLSDPEISTVLTGLRLWQWVQEHGGVVTVESGDLMNIATEWGHFPALSLDQIDDLCERLNLGIPE